MEVDGEFYPFLQLIKVRQALKMQAKGKLKTATGKGRGSLYSSFLRKLPQCLEVTGQFGRGYSTKAIF
jgi:hypothetical protein